MKRKLILLAVTVILTNLLALPVFAEDVPPVDANASSQTEISLSAFFTEEQLRAIGPETENLLKEQLSGFATKEALEREVAFLKKLLDERVAKIKQEAVQENDESIEKDFAKLNRRLFNALRLRRLKSIIQWRRDQIQRMQDLKGKARRARLAEIKAEQLRRRTMLNELISVVKQNRPIVVNVDSVDAANNSILTTRGNPDVKVAILITEKTLLTKLDVEGKRVAAVLSDFKTGDRIMAIVRDTEKQSELTGINVMNITKPAAAQ